MGVSSVAAGAREDPVRRRNRSRVRLVSQLGIAAVAVMATLLVVNTAAFCCYTPAMVKIAIPGWLGGKTARAAGLEIRPAERHFALYYGWPSAVNGAGGDVDRAVATFSQFAVVVFGDGLHAPTHPDQGRTAAIMARLKETSRVRVFGYVDLGVTTQNLPVESIVGAAQAWQRMGAMGIFLDDAGADFGVDGARRDAALERIRALGMRVILNAHDPDDAFRGRVRLGAGDGYLFESFQVADGRLLPTGEMLVKADRVLQLAVESGADVYAVASGPIDDPGFPMKLGYAWWSALLYGFDYFQYTTIDYGSLSGQLSWHAQEVPALGARYAEATVHHGWAEGVHWRQTERGEIRLHTGAEPGGSFVPYEIEVAHE